MNTWKELKMGKAVPSLLLCPVINRRHTVTAAQAIGRISASPGLLCKHPG